jgi:hypothetical protein
MLHLQNLVMNMGFHERSLSLLKSLLMAITGRFTDQESRLSPEPTIFLHWPIHVPCDVVLSDPKHNTQKYCRFCDAWCFARNTRHIVSNEDWPVLYPATKLDAEVTGIVLFGLEGQLQEIRTLQRNSFDFKIATVEIELADRRLTDLDAYIFVWNGEIGRLRARTWSPSSFMESEFYKNIAACAAVAEDGLEKDTIPRDLYYCNQWLAHQQEYSIPSFRLRTALKLRS